MPNPASTYCVQNGCELEIRTAYDGSRSGISVFPDGYEVDFYLPESGRLIQVAQSMDNPATREREIRALADGMSALGLSNGLILTDSKSQTITRNGFTITIRSLADWLLESE